ncbi:hypothetical protein GWP57_06520 [Gammaproteobacteria bacterium]|jgi:hypothetical protein|nr:hypothetical protein [Gammaproteobacteria bacterium]
MMISSSAKQPARLCETQLIAPVSGSLLSRKIWLPKLIYSALPFFYIAAGALALFATIYISTWLWILPHYLLFSAACLHMGVLIYRKRRLARKNSEKSAD